MTKDHQLQAEEGRALSKSVVLSRRTHRQDSAPLSSQPTGATVPDFQEAKRKLLSVLQEALVLLEGMDEDFE
jgi:hypothetical protein